MMVYPSGETFRAVYERSEDRVARGLYRWPPYHRIVGEQAIPMSHAPEEIARPEVRVVQGKVQGTLVEGGLAFKNLPYAAPPVGPNRWRAPQAASSWRGTRDASVFGPSCPQEPMGWNDVDAKRASEDCLSLNIWTPRVGQGTGQPGLPVMVWINGGGFRGGSASNNFNDGTKLMRHGVVAVTINYRLGVLGFLAHPDLARETADGSTGNYGLMDQVAALRWVHDNIAAFGGDPANVTAFGQSAGGIAISWLITSKSARGLFNRAILQSGNAFGSGLITLTRAQAEKVGQQFGAIAQLRQLPARKLIQRWQVFEAQAPQEHVAEAILDEHFVSEATPWQRHCSTGWGATLPSLSAIIRRNSRSISLRTSCAPTS